MGLRLGSAQRWMSLHRGRSGEWLGSWVGMSVGGSVGCSECVWAWMWLCAAMDEFAPWLLR
jgi:hypothetical protein